MNPLFTSINNQQHCHWRTDTETRGTAATFRQRRQRGGQCRERKAMGTRMEKPLALSEKPREKGKEMQSAQKRSTLCLVDAKIIYLAYKEPNSVLKALEM